MIEAPISPASSAALATASLLFGKSGCSGTGDEPVTAQVMMTFWPTNSSPETPPVEVLIAPSKRACTPRAHSLCTPRAVGLVMLPRSLNDRGRNGEVSRMRHSRDRILTTHVGSLPRSQTLCDMLLRRDRGEAYDAAEYDRVVADAVRDVVA